MRDDIVSRREVMKSIVAEYNRRYSEGGLRLAWIEKAVNDTPALQPSGGRLIDADRLKWHYSWWNNDEQRLFDEIVDAQPTVEPVVHGEWIDCTTSEHWCCSKCGIRAPMTWDPLHQEYVEWLSPACPNCGAKMDGGTK